MDRIIPTAGALAVCGHSSDRGARRTHPENLEPLFTAICGVAFVVWQR